MVGVVLLLMEKIKTLELSALVTSHRRTNVRILASEKTLVALLVNIIKTMVTALDTQNMSVSNPMMGSNPITYAWCCKVTLFGKLHFKTLF